MTLEKGKLDMTPLVDVVFLLLIFFMLSSKFIVQSSVLVNLPKAAGTEPQRIEEMSIAISEDGTLFYEDKEISLKGVFDLLDVKIKEDADKVLILKADQNVRHGKVVEVMGIAKDVGVKHIAIATKPGFSAKELE